MKFWLFICFEAVFFPILYFINEVRNRISSQVHGSVKIGNTPIVPIDSLVFEIHEWAGYPLERTKQIKSNTVFNCGLRNQIESMNDFDQLNRGKRMATYHLTVSDYSNSFQELIANEKLPISNFNLHKISNQGMDLAGYAYVVKNKISAKSNELVFLVNSSVSGNYANQLNDYILAFERNPNLGLLGVSYCTTINQSLIKNNFNPHLQSFFLVGRSSVLHELVKKNGEIFPGEFETNKYAIIRFGEAQLTSTVMNLGYDVGVVEPNGELVIFPQVKGFDNGYNAWKLLFGDRRLTNGAPNQVHKLKLD
jgi:hypothetical protein